jgi:hypothetical protein
MTMLFERDNGADQGRYQNQLQREICTPKNQLSVSGGIWEGLLRAPMTQQNHKFKSLLSTIGPSKRMP